MNKSTYMINIISSSDLVIMDNQMLILGYDF